MHSRLFVPSPCNTVYTYVCDWYAQKGTTQQHTKSFTGWWGGGGDGVHMLYIYCMMYNTYLYLLKWWVNPSPELCSELHWRPQHSPVAAEGKGENGITPCATQNQYSVSSCVCSIHMCMYTDTWILGWPLDSVLFCYSTYHTAHTVPYVVGDYNTCTRYM